MTRDDCLRDVKLEALAKAIHRCNRVVAAFPRDPVPLNDRFLLHSLAGNNPAACRDMAQAVKLAGRLPPQRLDAILRQDLAQRQASCRD
jgi:hypothetical protein